MAKTGRYRLSVHLKLLIMQTVLSIVLQDDNSLLVTSDVLALTLKDENSLVAWSRKFIRAEDYRSLHPELKDRLTQWRRAKAKEKNVSAYVVLTNSTLFAISDLAPTTGENLLAIPGFGPVRFDHYGDEILAIVEQSLKEERAEL